MFKLFLQEIIDRLFSVSPVGCWDIRYMNPIGAALIVLPNQLIKLEVGLDVVKPLAAFRQVSVDADVCRLTFRVLRVRDSSDGSVQPITAKSAADLDGLFHRLS